MNFRKWPKRSAEKNYFMVSNEVFSIDLDYPEISVYCYLLRCENRETYQCYPSYKTIGNALGMCENTVSKYVRRLEDKGLIYTEPTIIQSKDGKPLNGNLCYTIRPIQGAIEAFYERQLQRVKEDTALYRAKQRLAKYAPKDTRTLRVRLCGRRQAPVPTRALKPDLTLFRTDLRGRKKNQEKGATLFRHRSAHNCPQCGQFRAFEGTLFPTKNRRVTLLSVTRPKKAHQSRCFNDAISNSEVIL